MSKSPGDQKLRNYRQRFVLSFSSTCSKQGKIKSGTRNYLGTISGSSIERRSSKPCYSPARYIEVST
jgi:hypothetical protein